MTLILIKGVYIVLYQIWSALTKSKTGGPFPSGKGPLRLKKSPRVLSRPKKSPQFLLRPIRDKALTKIRGIDRLGS